MTKTEAIENAITEAKEIGIKTFENGGSQVPAHSTELNKIMSDLNLGIGEGGIEIMQAFIGAWHKASDLYFFGEEL